MNDEYAAPAGFIDDLVHSWRHFADARRSAFAPVLIPHIANDDRSPFGIPLDGFLDRVPITTFFGGFDGGASVKLQQFGLRCRKAEGGECQAEDNETCPRA